MPSHAIQSRVAADREFVRRAYGAFRAGAGLRADDVDRLLSSMGHHLTTNRLRELGRDSDRGASITAEELWALISAWATEQQGPR